MANERDSAALGRLSYIIVDAADPERLVRFWGTVLGLRAERRSGPYVFLEPLPGGLQLGFQAVTDEKVGKNRLHLDLRVRDLDAAVGRVIALGGDHLGDVAEDGDSWQVMADPEGNEFCLLREE